jgi:hypothetical protein
MEKLGVFKVTDDGMLICGYFDTKEDAIKYLTEIGKLINFQFQHNLVGEYIIIPTLYYNLQQMNIQK